MIDLPHFCRPLLLVKFVAIYLLLPICKGIQGGPGARWLTHKEEEATSSEGTDTGAAEAGKEGGKPNIEDVFADKDEAKNRTDQAKEFASCCRPPSEQHFSALAQLEFRGLPAVPRKAPF